MPSKYYNRRGRKTFDLKALKAKVSRVITSLEKAMADAETAEELAKLTYAFVNASREYRSVFEATDLAAKLDEIEARINEQGSRGLKG